MIPVLIAALFVIYLFLIFPSLRRHPARQLMKGAFIAHRGIHADNKGLPENTMPAFIAAAKLGFAIELDERLTKDGKVVVFHDDTLKRLCGADGRVEDKTLAQLSEYTVLSTDQHIPTLEQVVRAVDVPLLIEIKPTHKNNKALCKAVDDILREHNGRFIIQSFYPLAITWFRFHHRSLCRGILATNYAKKKGSPLHHILAGWLLFNFAARPDFISYEARQASSFPRSLCSALGALPVGWTFCSPAELELHGGMFETYIFEGFLPDKPYISE